LHITGSSVTYALAEAVAELLRLAGGGGNGEARSKLKQCNCRNLQIQAVAVVRSWNSSASLAVKGGSGVIILRYPDFKTITIGAGLTGSERAASGGFKRATITAGTGNVSWA
jgi:hypothetical protein